MSKKKHKARKHKTPTLLPARLRYQQESGRTSERPPSNRLLDVLKGLGVAATVLASYVAYLELAPVFSVALAEPLNVSQPLSTPFHIPSSGHVMLIVVN